MPAFDGLRGFSALYVALFHAWIIGGREALGGAATWLQFGWMGVDVFFGLSAFLLTANALNRRAHDAAHALGEPWRGYLARRILRVFPAYYAALTALLALSVAGLHGTLASVPDMGLHLLMMHSLDRHFVDSINGVFWSLPIEWQFYLLLPLLVLLLLRVGAVAWVLLGCAVAILAYLTAAHFSAEFPLAQLTGRMDTFAFGMAAALLLHRRAPRLAVARAGLVAGIALLAAVPVLFAAVPNGFRPGGWIGIGRALAIDMGVTLTLLGLAANERWGAALFATRPVLWLGKISYSVYLVHLPIMVMLSEAGVYDYGRSGLLIVAACSFPVVALASWASFSAFERPFMRAGAKHGPARPLRVLAAWGALILLGSVVANAAPGG